MSHETVVKNYAERKVNSRRKTVSWGGGNVFCEGDLIYSYGTHFPMAKYLGQQKGKNFYIKNGDKFSDSTSAHQGMVQSLCEGPTLSRSAIAAAGFSFVNLTLDDIVCFRPDLRKYIYKDTQTGRFYEERHYRRGEGWGDEEERPDSGSDFYTGALEEKLVEKEWKAPRQGMFVPHYSRQGDAKERIVSGVWHVLGAVVLRRGDTHYLCSLDEGSYFVSQLPVQVKTVDQAFKALKPKEVLRAEKAGLAVKRQGEWFFVPTGLDSKAMPLPTRESPGTVRPASSFVNYHVLHQFLRDGVIYARGNVYHRWKLSPGKWRATGQHKTLHLTSEYGSGLLEPGWQFRLRSSHAVEEHVHRGY